MTCKRCQPHPIFTYTITAGEYAWSTTAAIELVRRSPREPLPVPRDNLIEIMGSYDVVREHLDHVDPAIPGIAIPFHDEGRDFLLMIDGGHRAARAIRDGISFSVYVLDQTEADACLLLSPAGLGQAMQGGVLIL